MDPATTAAQLRRLADELDSGSGRVRWVCAVFCVEAGVEGQPPGAGMLRLSRNDADPDELADAMVEAVGRVGRTVIPVS